MSEHGISLSTLPATPAERRLALAVLLLSAAIFVIVAPFARIPLTPVAAFIPIYESALVINDLVTAALLFGQFGFLGSRSLLVLAAGYLFTATITVSHALSFPGLFAPTGLLGAGPQSTAWLYMFWHGGFPLLVIAYALGKNDPRQVIAPNRRVRAAVLSVFVVLLVVVSLTLVATLGHRSLPAIMDGNQYTPLMITVVTSVWVFSLLALFVLWRQRPRTVLDVWLMIVICAWLFDVALAAVLNAGRFDVGFYAGRIYGLLASCFVLIVLLIENSVLYARLVRAHDNERRAHRWVLDKTDELIAANKELDAFSYSVSHDLRAPLRAVDGYAQMLEEDYGPRLDAEGNRLLGVVRASARQMGRLIDDLLAFSRAGREPIKTRPVQLEDVVQQIIGDLQPDHTGRPIEFRIGKLGVADVDPALVKQALTNLLSNAVKFTEKKNPAVVEVGRQVQRAAGDPIVYYVKDNGAGFDMKYYDKLFGVFQRLHSASEYPGTGVGLAIVNRVITRHGGKVWAEARENEGATFFFTLGGGGAGADALPTSNHERDHMPG